MTQKQYPRLAVMHYGKGYKLNPKVKNPTLALKIASQIGTLVYESEDMRETENRDALLVTGYGTALKSARESSINETMAAIKDALPNVRTEFAFTSEAIRARIKKSEGIDVPSSSEAIETLAREGFNRVAITPMNIFPGLDYLQNVDAFNAHKGKFKKLVLGTPLLYWMGQEDQRDDVGEFVDVLRGEFGDNEDMGALLLMAHGTLHPSNSYYVTMQTRVDMAGWKNVFVYTMKGWPRLDHIIPILRERGVRRVKIAALMLAAGSHATNDMAARHREILEAEGFDVSVSLKGLGEIPSVRAMYVNRAVEAWHNLTDDSVSCAG